VIRSDGFLEPVAIAFGFLASTRGEPVLSIVHCSPRDFGTGDTEAQRSRVYSGEEYADVQEGIAQADPRRRRTHPMLTVVSVQIGPKPAACRSFIRWDARLLGAVSARLTSRGQPSSQTVGGRGRSRRPLQGGGSAEGIVGEHLNEATINWLGRIPE
jgi:hypothetical protein